MILGKGRGTEVCYNVQMAVDSKHKLIIANDVTNLIKRNPIPALFVGIGVGFLLARACTPRS